MSSQEESKLMFGHGKTLGITEEQNEVIASSIREWAATRGNAECVE